MKWVKASHGRIPDGYTPVQGGYEDSGQQLYHALAKIEGHWVPGKTGLHLLGGNFPYHHQEVRMVSRDGPFQHVCASARISLADTVRINTDRRLPGAVLGEAVAERADTSYTRQADI